MNTPLSIRLHELREEMPQPTLTPMSLHMRGGVLELSTSLSVQRGLNLPLRGIDVVGIVFGVSDDDRPPPRLRSGRREMRRLKTGHGVDKRLRLHFGKLTLRRSEHPISPIERDLANKVE
jgi:hypothetical protein